MMMVPSSCRLAIQLELVGAARRRVRRDIVIAGVVGGLIGAKIWYVC